MFLKHFKAQRYFSFTLLFKNSVRTSQETHHVSVTESSRLMLFRETVAVYCENHTEHINTLCGHLVRTSQQTHYVSATEPNRLMLFRETVAVYCENHTEHINTLCGQNAKFLTVKSSGIYCNHLSLKYILGDVYNYFPIFVYSSFNYDYSRSQYVSSKSRRNNESVGIWKEAAVV
jgi:translation initiation factor IF-1